VSAPGSFEDHRHLLFGVAYRMLGSVSDAEDVVQDAWLRWSAIDRSHVEDAGAFLTTVVSRLSLDRLRSARHRRERYVGPWLPEPLPTQRAPQPPPDGPEEAAELADSLTFAFLTMLDQLEPEERAVLLLHDVFGYRFREVADMVDRSEAACRQLASRARRRLHVVGTAQPPGGTRPADAQVERFLTAMATGDIDSVLAVLAPDVVLVSDGGPDHRAARRPVHGSDRVGRLLVHLASRMPAGTTVTAQDINGEPGIIVAVDGVPFLTLGFAGGPQGIDRVWLVRNPSKLAHLPRGASRDADDP
jgi:RNA polymerase sigma-70 factor (ECF subfamily)